MALLLRRVNCTANDLAGVLEADLAGGGVDLVWFNLACQVGLVLGEHRLRALVALIELGKCRTVVVALRGGVVVVTLRRSICHAWHLELC